jgi:hypothetical protein
MKTTTFCGKRFLAGSLAALGFSTLSAGLFAQPVMSYTVSGASGDYTLDFTVNNTTPGTQTQNIVYWGVRVDGRISGIPTGDESLGVWSPYSYDGAGANILYNVSWGGDVNSLPPGTTLSGFTVTDTDATAPTFVPYFAYGYDFGVDYTGPDNLDPLYPYNPLFEGNATPAGAGVPDSGTTMSLLGIALGAVGGISRKCRKA